MNVELKWEGCMSFKIGKMIYRYFHICTCMPTAAIMWETCIFNEIKMHGCKRDLVVICISSVQPLIAIGKV